MQEYWVKDCIDLDIGYKPMPKKAGQKEKQILKTNPEGYLLARKAFNEAPQKNKASKKAEDIKGIYHWQVVAFKKWFFGNSRIKKFPSI